MNITLDELRTMRDEVQAIVTLRDEGGTVDQIVAELVGRKVIAALNPEPTPVVAREGFTLHDGSAYMPAGIVSTDWIAAYGADGREYRSHAGLMAWCIVKEWRIWESPVEEVLSAKPEPAPAVARKGFRFHMDGNCMPFGVDPRTPVTVVLKGGAQNSGKAGNFYWADVIEWQRVEAVSAWIEHKGGDDIAKHVKPEQFVDAEFATHTQYRVRANDVDWLFVKRYRVLS